MEYDIVSSTVPELPAAARTGTANAAIIGAANYWHKRADSLERELGERRVLAFIVGILTGFGMTMVSYWMLLP